MHASVFIPCLVDQFYPSAAAATIKLLRWAGVEVELARDHTCCGQPSFNDGYWEEAVPAAAHTLALLEESRYVIVPSGSCTAMMRHFYPRLLGPRLGHERVGAFARRVFELCEFLVGVAGVTGLPGAWHGSVTYHDSCHLLRELGVREEPRKLLRAKQGVNLVEMEHADFCCGFGGAFAVKLPHISGAILAEKLDKILASGARVVTAADAGCLMHIAGGLARRGSPIRVVHVAEILAAGI